MIVIDWTRGVVPEFSEQVLVPRLLNAFMSARLLLGDTSFDVLPVHGWLASENQH